MEHKTFWKQGKKAKVKKPKKEPFYPKMKTVHENRSKAVRLLGVVSVVSPEEAYARCYTCLSLVNIKLMDCGHYIKRGNKSVTFNMKFNLRPQCKFCNDHGKGEQEKYRAHLIEEMGSGPVAEFELFAKKNKNVVTKIHGYALRIINEESKAIINRITKEKGIQKW